MSNLIVDIKHHAALIVKGFAADRLVLDYSMESFKVIDHFFDLHVRDGVAVASGRMAKNTGPILFSIGSYIGETLIKNVSGTTWEIDEEDPEAEVNAAIKLPNGEIVWPMQRAVKRFYNGEEDGIYVYGYALTKDYDIPAAEKKKGRWKFWK